MAMAIWPAAWVRNSTSLDVKEGSVVTGSYTYDEPNAGDARFVPLKDVPPIVYSEALADLRAITQSASESDDA